jgi:hypothetical protein
MLNLQASLISPGIEVLSKVVGFRGIGKVPVPCEGNVGSWPLTAISTASVKYNFSVIVRAFLTGPFISA